MADELNLVDLWKKVCALLLKEGDATQKTLWEASGAAVPLVIDNEVLVVGLKPAEMRMSGYLTNAANKRFILSAIERVAGRRLDIEVIEGQVADDWEKLKARHQAQTDRITDEAQFRSEHKGALGVWEVLAVDLHKLFTETQQRRFPEQLARLLIRGLPIVADAEEKAREAEPESEQLHFTHLNRSFDKLSTYTDIPAPIVALEYMRYRSSRRKQQG